MHKFITAIDGLKYSESAIHYAVQLAKTAGATLVGVFLEDKAYHGYKIYELLDDDGTVSETKRATLEEKDVSARSMAVKHFEKACRKEGVNYIVHHDRKHAIHELLYESLYADLVIIDKKETLTHYEENIPTGFIRHLLERISCPALVVPSVYTPVTKQVLLYDGGPSSVFAIKQFSYMFPELKSLPAEVITVKEDRKQENLPGSKLIKEFMKWHFPHAGYTLLKGEPGEAIVKHISKQTQDAIVVAGAYQRGNVSRWFKPSIADKLMQELELPLFIAHSK